MKREFLEGLGLDKETIDKIMPEHGKAVEAAKVGAAEAKTTIDTLNGQLEELQKTVKTYEGVDINGLQAEIQKAQMKHQEDIKQLKRIFALESAAKERGAVSIKAALAELDEGLIKEDKNGNYDVSAAFDDVLTRIPLLFAQAKPETPRGTTPPEGARTTPTSTKPFGELSTDERAQLKEADPALYESRRQEFLER